MNTNDATSREGWRWLHRQLKQGFATIATMLSPRNDSLQVDDLPSVPTREQRSCVQYRPTRRVPRESLLLGDILHPFRVDTREERGVS